jgi:asparagine synthase (glutamine-hydrolysing)
MAEALGRGVTTTTVGFNESAHNELDAAALTARRFDTHHHQEILEPRLSDVLDRIVDAFDEPFGDSSAIPTFHVSQMARRHVTVALSGDGGDEAFGGYGFRYAPHALESVVRPLAGKPGRAAFGWIGERWPRSPRVPRVLRWGTVFENISMDPADVLLRPVHGEAARRAAAQVWHRIAIRAPVVYEAVTEPHAVHGQRGAARAVRRSENLSGQRRPRESRPHEHAARS